MPENSQITALPFGTLELGLIVTVVAPGTLFLAYHRSATAPAPKSTERAAPASAQVFPPSSVMPVIVKVVSVAGPDCQPTTMRFPFPVAGMVHVMAGKLCGPQDVT